MDGDGCKNTKMHGLHNAVSVMWLHAGQSLQTHWDGPGAHGDGDTGATQTRVAGMGSWQSKQMRHGKADADQQIQHNRRACEAGRPLVSFSEVCGRSAVVMATLKTGSDLPYSLPPTYRLCLSVHTHSLSL